MELLTLGRILIGLFYVYMAFNNLYYEKILLPKIAYLPIPGLKIFYRTSLILSLLAGLMIIANYAIGLAVIYLIAFIILTTPLYHNIWNAKGETLINNRVVWANNLAQLGILLVLLSMLIHV